MLRKENTRLDFDDPASLFSHGYCNLTGLEKEQLDDLMNSSYVQQNPDPFALA